MKYKHLFFDLDHTLWDFEANAYDTLNELYFGYELADKGVDDFDLFFNRYSHHNSRLWSRYTKGYIRQDELRWKRVWLTLLDFKIADKNLSKNISEEFLELLPTKKQLFPYTIEILNYLKSKQYVLHLVTNGFEAIQYCKLTSSNLLDYFEEVITSEGCNSVKPNKAIFDYALSKANASVTESIMLGDNPEADIQGGINAGMDTVFVNHLKISLENIKPTYTIHHLKELEEIF